MSGRAAAALHIVCSAEHETRPDTLPHEMSQDTVRIERRLDELMDLPAPQAIREALRVPPEASRLMSRPDCMVLGVRVVREDRYERYEFRLYDHPVTMFDAHSVVIYGDDEDDCHDYHVEIVLLTRDEDGHVMSHHRCDVTV